MTYMYPLGGGVSKAGVPNAGQGHHWSDKDHCFWCCQGMIAEIYPRDACRDHCFWCCQGVCPPPPPTAREISVRPLGSAPRRDLGEIPAIYLGDLSRRRIRDRGVGSRRRLNFF